MRTPLEILQAEEIARLKKEYADIDAKYEKLKNPEFVKHNGLLWKKTDSGVENLPYCPICKPEQVMMGFPTGEPEIWKCPLEHQFSFAIKPPKDA